MNFSLQHLSNQVHFFIQLFFFLNSFRMEAIKKKMQAMKVEKDMACDKCDVAEEAMKAAKIKASQAEMKLWS